MKKSYSFRFPVAEIKDVLVIGGGPAGVVAALAAARSGADTLLIERAAYLVPERKPPHFLGGCRQ